MSHDVFLVAALEDGEIAKLVARKLRALKFKVRYDAKQTDDVFDDKEARDVSRAKTMLVLWSENAVQSNFVRAAASMGYSMENQSLVQVGLDKTVPYEPFKKDKRIALAGLTSRKTVDGWYQVVEALSRPLGRSGLKAWMSLSAKDEEGRAAWMREHPRDALTLAERRKQDQKAAAKPRPAPEAKDAAVLAAAAIKAKPAPAAVQSSPVASILSPEAASAFPARDEGLEDRVGLAMLAGVGAAIALLLLLARLMQSEQAADVRAAQPLPPIANAAPVVATCPAGQIPASLLAPRVLEPGPIIVDE
ncbi:MAG: hypothetical protein AAFX03_03055 [Pseudomonadota bacterium]